MRVSLLPLEGDTVQFLAAAGAAASLLPLLRQSRPPFPGAAACPARPGSPSRPGAPASHRRARGVPGERGGAAPGLWGSPRPHAPGRQLRTPAPPLAAERREGKGELRCGAGGGGRRPKPQRAGAAGAARSDRAAAAGTCSLIRAGRESPEWVAG